MVMVIAVLVKHCLEIQDDKALAAGEEPHCDDEEVNLYQQNKQQAGETVETEVTQTSDAEDKKSSSSMELLSTASTFIVDSTVSTLMYMSQAYSLEGVLGADSKAHEDPRVRNLKEDGSSVWCWGSHHTERICRFHNLCYFPKEDDFVFFHSPHSVVSGVPADRFSPTLLDMSSVHDHNMQYFNYVDLPASQAGGLQIDFVDNLSLIYRRFNPDNLMHVIHDDLLPMYNTLQMILGNATGGRSEPFDIQLVFMEGWSPGDYINLYEIFSTQKPVFKSDLQSQSHITCFRDAYVGITKATTWYQYGFRIPQGPIPNHAVSAHEVRQFTNYMRHRLHIADQQIPHGEGYVVLLSRKHNRLILNEVELTMSLARELKTKIVSVGVETHSAAEMIGILSRAVVLVGMHGSLLTLAMFLPPGGILVELFPYAVNPNNYTPYRTMTELPGMGLLYRPWRNMHAANTITHPDRPWETGGITHLSQAEQDRITTSIEVPRHLCCRDPEWLFRIYQDTLVDIPSLLTLIHQSLEQRTQLLNSNAFQVEDFLAQRIYPSQVENLRCEPGKGSNNLNLNSLTPPSLFVAWDPPWNVKYLAVNNVKYEVWIQESGLEHYTAWILSRTSYQFTAGLKPHVSYNIWVRCIINDTVNGPFNIEHCTCST